jgi:hypothetical protein
MRENLELNGRRALVTGGTQGIGDAGFEERYSPTESNPSYTDTR